MKTEIISKIWSCINSLWTNEEKKAKKLQRSVVLAFAEDMVAKLELRSENQGRPCLFGQDFETSSWVYFKRLDQEVKELRRALNAYDQRKNPKNAESLISECCDVANFAAAIAENTKTKSYNLR